MLRAVKHDFSQIAGVQVVTSDDENFENGLLICDYFIIIAPETDGILLELTERAEDSGKGNLGSSPETIKVTGDKLIFSQVMNKARISAPETFIIENGFAPQKHFGDRWVVKPRDGAGGFYSIIDAGDIHIDLSRYTGMIAQEYANGEAMSLSIISSSTELKILSVNRQNFSQSLEYEGGEILSVEPDKRLYEMAQEIWNAVSRPIGYWGIDYVETKEAHIVIEVNSRLTTSYCALSRALDINPAKLWWDAVLNNSLPDIGTRLGVRFSKAGDIWEA